MTTFNRVQGDTGDTITAFLYGVATFAGATVAAHVWQTGVTPTTLTAAVTDGTDSNGQTCGVCVVHLASWITTATPGGWLLEYQVTFTDTTIATWPAETPDVLRVRIQGS